MALTEAPASPTARPRPRPSMADALAASGGAIVTFGVLLLAIDVVAPDDGDSSFSGTPAGLIFAALIAVSFVGLFFAPRATHAGWITTIAFSVPLMWGFFILPDTNDFDDIRIFLLVSILSWAACFFIPRSSGRPIYLALAALFLYSWVMGEVGNVDAYFSASIPAPKYTTPAQIVTAVQGGETDAPEVQRASLRTQTIGDLDPDDPLYPLAEECANGDNFACDDLWDQSTPGSDFEAFAESCGGRSAEQVFGECAITFGEEFEDDFGDNFTDTTSFFDDDFQDDFEDDFQFEDDFGDDFTDDTLFPGQNLDVSPLSTGGGDDKTLELAIVSLLFAAGYLGAKQLFDRRGWERVGTAFVLPGIVALVQGVAGLGDATESAVFGGLLTMAGGLGLGILGYLSRRRFTTWAGGFMASIGAIIIAFEVADTDNVVDDSGDLDLITPGVIFTLFGLGVVVLGFVIARLFEDRDQPPLATNGPNGPLGPPPSDPLGPYVPAVPPPVTPAAWTPSEVPTAPPSPSPSPWAPAPPPAEPPTAPTPPPEPEPAPAPDAPREEETSTPPPAPPSPWAPPPTEP